MGLDGVELVIEVEEAFDVPIPDEAAQSFRTPGDLFDFVRDSGFQSMPVGACLSQAVFHRLRRALIAEFRVSRERVRPSARIADLFPRFFERPRRAGLARRLEVRRPPRMLRESTWLRRDWGTVGQLSELVLACNYGLLAEQAGFWNPDEGWSCLRLLIADQLAIPIERITRDASFVNDLGLKLGESLAGRRTPQRVPRPSRLDGSVDDPRAPRWPLP